MITPKRTLVDNWTEKELQLNRLHEEVLAKRESLLRTTKNYFEEQVNKGGNRLNITNNATLRNKSLIEDIEELEDSIYENINKAPSARFLTLKNNYWSMVNGLLPLWEESIGISDAKKKLSPDPSLKAKKQRTPKASRRIK